MNFGFVFGCNIQMNKFNDKGSGRMVYTILYFSVRACINVIDASLLNKEYYTCDSYFCMKSLCMLHTVEIGWVIRCTCIWEFNSNVVN